jgi:hypothetical protein
VAFKKSCDKCDKDLVSTETALSECNKRSAGSVTETAIVVGVVGLIGGFFLGKGLR